MTAANAISVIENALRLHGAELRRFVRSRAHGLDVDDILQNAALRAVERADALKDPDCVLPWLFAIHKNVITDVARKSASDRRLRDTLAAEPVPVIETHEDDPICGCAIAQAYTLKPQHSSILDLVDIGGVSLKEAARLLGVTVNTATVRLHRARTALKQQLSRHCGVTTLRQCIDCKCSYDGCSPM